MTNEEKSFLKISVYPGIGDMQYNYAASYFRYKDELASVSFGFTESTNTMKIFNIQKSSNVHVNEYKYIATELFSDILIDTVCRREYDVKRIIGKLAYPDRDNGNWKKSVPFYINFPKYCRRFNLTLHIYDKKGNELNLNRALKDILDEMYNSGLEYKFIYDVSDVDKSEIKKNEILPRKVIHTIW